LARVYSRVREFHQQFGQVWEPAPLLRRLAEEGSTFAAWDAAREK
jgi:3-hydroxyacyl-CoA dehydrogenase